MVEAARVEAEQSNVRTAVEVLDDLVAQSFVGLMDAYELQISPAAPVEGLEFARYVSSIGFSSQGICGSIMLALPRTVVAATQPTADEDGGGDWASELANQMAGRLKNSLLRYGLTITISLPVMVMGEHLKWAAFVEGVTQSYSFDSSQGRMVVRLDAEVQEDLVLEEQEAENDDGMDEGDFQMF